MKLTLGQIADWMHAEGDFDSRAEALGYSIDSRTLAAGDLFFAVKGERTNGHDYVETALSNGAAAAVVSDRWLVPANVDPKKLMMLPDGDECILHAMQRLAHAVRRAWGKRVIGITGSAGKTTTKECVASVLSRKYNVLKTEGNLNNHFGVPLMLLRLQPEHELAVLEMGMNHAGEIAALAKIAKPDWGIVSNVGMAHSEFFSDGIEGIARAKRELIEALPPNGIAFLNGDDLRVRGFANDLAVQAVLYGTGEGCAVRAEKIDDLGLNGTRFSVRTTKLFVPEWNDDVPVTLRLPGRHNVFNALAALAVGLASHVEMKDAVDALGNMRSTEKRGNLLTWHGAEIVNDTYNSNPAALKSMIEALKRTPAERRILVAGEMLELGPDGPRLHAECGAAAASAGIDWVVGVRGLARELVDAAAARETQTVFVETPEDAGGWLRQNLRKGDVALLKASRGVRLEGALEALGY